MAMSDPYTRNLLPDPKPVDTADWAFYTGKDIRLQMLSDNRLHITNQSGTPDSYVYTHLKLPAGTYRFGAEVSSPQGAYASNLLRGDIQLRRRQLQTVAFCRDAARRDGRIPCDRSFQRILFVSREPAARLGVAA